MLPEYVARIEWPESRVRAERQRALRTLLTTAVERSPWHRERLAGIDLGGLGEADIESLPAMTKTDLMDNFHGIVTDRRVTRQLCERHRSQATSDAYLLDAIHV